MPNFEWKIEKCKLKGLPPFFLKYTDGQQSLLTWMTSEEDLRELRKTITKFLKEEKV